MAALELEWAFGINSTVPNCVHLLENNEKNQEIIFYPISNNGVIYNLVTKKQQFLLQHTNIITSSILSPDKQLIILGDSGASNDNSCITIWHGATYELLSVYKLPTNFGVQALAINPSTNLLTAIVNESVPSNYDKDSNQIQHKIIQHLIVWSLTVNSHLFNDHNDNRTATDSTDITAEDPHKIEFKVLAQHQIKSSARPAVPSPDGNDDTKLHHFVTFNHDSTEIVTHGASMEQFIFWTLPKMHHPDTATGTGSGTATGMGMGMGSGSPFHGMDVSQWDEMQLIAYYVQSADNHNNCDLSGIGTFTASCFIPLPDGPIITGTNSGDLIYWDYDTKKTHDFDKLLDDETPKHRIIQKVIHKVTRGSINVVEILTNNDIIAMASSSGSVRFYDFQCRVIGWLDYLGDHVTSISFPLGTRKYSVDFGKKGNDNKFNVPSMIVGTKNNKVIKVEATYNEQGDVELTTNVVIETFNTVCTAMSAHPVLPMVAVGNSSGEIQIWEMVRKTMLQTVSLSQPQKITDIKFSSNGEWLVFGTDSHYLRIYETSTFSEQQFFKSNYDGSIGHLCFSFNSEWLAFSQSNRISVYRFWYCINDQKREKPKEWVLIGNYKSHLKDIVALHFSEPSGIDAVSIRSFPRLFSIGNDHLINEYNLQRSSSNFGLRLKFTFHLTQISSPTALQFIPGIPLDADSMMTYSIQSEAEDLLAPKFDEKQKEWKYIEDLLVSFDDELKLHFYHSPRSFQGTTMTQTADTQTLNSHRKGSKNTTGTTGNGKGDDQEEPEEESENEEEEKEEVEPLSFRRTVLGPSFGAPIKKLCPHCSNQGPFNGNPHRYFGCNGHPGHIHGFELVQHGDTQWLVTNGGFDKSLCFWKINGSVLVQQVADCDEENNLNAIYKELLLNEEESDDEGGNEEENEDDTLKKRVNLYEEIKNYFYFVQIEEQGSISTVPRSISGTINIDQITSIFQALGSFSTKNDVDRIRKEIQHRFGGNILGNNCDIDIHQFIEIFINYRSTFEISMDDLHRAFMNIIGIESGDNETQPRRVQRLSMTREFFLDMLQRKGDKMPKDEMLSCFESLTGYQRKQLGTMMPEQIDAEFFTKDILGLQQED